MAQFGPWRFYKNHRTLPKLNWFSLVMKFKMIFNQYSKDLFNFSLFQGLVETIAKIMANKIKGKTPEDIRKMWCIPIDFDFPDLQIKKKNA